MIGILKKLGEHLKDLKKTKKIIEEYDSTFGRVGLVTDEQVEKVLEGIENQIKLCEFYFKTKKRKDLFNWIFKEKYKPNDWSKERNIFEYSNGKVKAIIEIFRNPLSTKIESHLKIDCDLDLYTNLEYGNKIEKNLRSEKSINSYIEEMKEFLLEKVQSVRYDNEEINFMDFILNPTRGENE